MVCVLGYKGKGYSQSYSDFAVELFIFNDKINPQTIAFVIFILFRFFNAR